MTLRELWMLVLRYWVLVVLVVVVGSALGFGYAKMKDSRESYEAESHIVVGDYVNNVAGFAENVTRLMADQLKGQGVSVSVSADSTIMTVTVTADGPDAQACIEVANAVATAANEAAVQVYAHGENPYHGEVGLATEASAASSKALMKFLLFGCAGGVFIALVIVLLLDLKHRFVKTPEAVQALVELPVLDSLPAVSGEKLAANVRFAADRMGERADVLSVLVIPVGQAQAAQEAASLLKEVPSEQGAATLAVSCSDPLSETMAGVYAAREADVVVVVVEQWKDSTDALVSCVDELRFAEARIAGVVFCNAAKRRAA